METNNQKNDQNIIPNDADKQQKGVNVPNLRFKNIGADNFPNWTISDIGKECDFFNGVAHENDVVERGQYIIVNSKFVSSNGKIKKYTNTLGFELKCNDIVMVMSDVPNGKAIAKCYLIDQNNKYTLNQRICCLRTEHNSVFILNQINRNAYFLKFDDGVKQTNLRKEDILNCPLYICCKKEQEKIANFLSLIDKRIDTQSKIIEDLELFKKGIWNYIYLTKSSDWKCVKLSDILCERKDFALKGDEFIHATLSKDGIFAKTDRYDRDFLVTNDEKEYKITRLNDICYNPANLKFGVICLNKFGDAIFSPIYVTYIVKNDFIPSFVELILTSSRFLKYIRKYEQGTVYERMAVNSEDFLKGEILIPTKDKQKAIADYFDMLDLKIKKEKDILELYKKQKAYLLKNMFI